MDYAKVSLEKHYEWKGKLEVTARAKVDNKEALSLAYTPGVAQPCLEIQKDVNKSYELTRRWNTVAVVTDGTAVLGLGDIGPEAGTEQLCLNGSTPTKGIIYNKGGSEAKVKVKNVIIYEPLYTVTITKENNPNPDPEQDPYIEKDYIFTMLYDINPSKWIKYVIETNDDNTYKIASKSILNSPPILYDGRNAEGATIQATLNCEFKGVKEIFTTKTPTPYKISVTQANDIVIANIDNRKK